MAIRVKPEYGPTLGRMLEPRWRRAGGATRALVLAAGVAFLVLAAAVVLTLEPARYSQGGSFPFSFTYRGLYREKPEPGGYARVVARYPDGSIKYLYAVNPLVLPPYQGEPSGALPVYATGYARSLPARFPGLRRTGRARRVSTRFRRTRSSTRCASTAVRCTAATCSCCPNGRARVAASRS